MVPRNNNSNKTASPSSFHFVSNVDLTTASPCGGLAAYIAATTTQEDRVTVPVLARFVIARGERASAGLLTVNQVLPTCAGAVEAGSADGKPGVARVVIAALNEGAGADGGPNPHADPQRQASPRPCHEDAPMGLPRQRGPAIRGRGRGFPFGCTHHHTRRKEPRSPATEPSMSRFSLSGARTLRVSTAVH